MREVDERYAVINKAREELEVIREKCSHETWREGLHVDEYLPTNTRHGAICNVCDKFLWRTPRVDKPVTCDYADDFDFLQGMDSVFYTISPCVNLNPKKFEVIIGRDILNRGTFLYKGLEQYYVIGFKPGVYGLEDY